MSATSKPPLYAPARHAAEHFFKGVCICVCRNCVGHYDNKHREPFCTDADCPPELCGMKWNADKAGPIR